MKSYFIRLSFRSDDVILGSVSAQTESEKSLNNPSWLARQMGEKKSFSVSTDVDQSPKGRENKNQGVRVQSCVFLSASTLLKSAAPEISQSVESTDGTKFRLSYHLFYSYECFCKQDYWGHK